MSALIEPATRTNPHEFGSALLEFINHGLRTLDRTPRPQWRVELDTPLFETGLIDSLAILHLMAFVEQFTGRAVQPRMVVMKHFRTVSAIVETFGERERNENS